MNKFNNIVDLTCNLHLIPSMVSIDVLKRITDWLLSGGTIEDEYIIRQLEYASLFISGDNNKYYTN